MMIILTGINFSTDFLKTLCLVHSFFTCILMSHHTILTVFTLVLFVEETNCGITVMNKCFTANYLTSNFD